MTLAKRTFTSGAWKIGSNLFSLVVVFVRSIILARLLPVEIFGIFAYASSITGLSVILTDFGISGAFIHRAPETNDVDQAAAVQFTLRSLFTLIWTVIFFLGALFLTEPHSPSRTALFALIIIESLSQLMTTPALILMRKVEQRRQAEIEIVRTLIATPLMIWLAWKGVTLWVLLAGEILTVGIKLLMYYVWKPVWKPRFSFDRNIIKYYLDYGKRNFLNSILYQSLDRVDDIWVGAYLGDSAMGLYSKAYSLATYPRQILANPINWVIGGAFAELKGKRDRLSYLFRMVNIIMIRSSFYLATLLALIAPEFILVLLGEKWLPMLTAFQLMLVFTLFDPMKIIISNVISLAGGEPQIVVRIRLFQLGIMLLGIFILGPIMGINGVAIAVDVMLFAGIVMLLWNVRSYVDFSIADLFGIPAAAIALGGSVAYFGTIAFGPVLVSPILMMFIRGLLFTLVFLAVTLLFEFGKLKEIFGYVRRLVQSRQE